MSGSRTYDRTRSTYSNQREASERTAVTIATERLPWHPLVQERFKIERSAWRALVDAIYPSAKTVDGVILALSYCKARNLDPFKKPVHVVPTWSTALNKVVETVWPGIGELRTTAFRTGQYAGCDEAEFGPDIKETFTYVEVKDGRETGKREDVTVVYPEWGRMTIHRVKGDLKFSVPGPKVYWKETYATRSRWTDCPNEMWAKRPRGQLEKCVEAAAIRRAFPEEAGNEMIPEEIGGTSEGVVIEGERPVEEFVEHAIAESLATSPSQQPRDTQRQTDGQPRASSAWVGRDGETLRRAAPPEQPPPEPTEEWNAYLVDEGNVGDEVAIYGYLPWANALERLCLSRPQHALMILENNDPAIQDIQAATSEEAKVAANVIADIPEEVRLAQAEAQPDHEPAVLQVPMKDSKPDWLAYQQAATAELNDYQTAAELHAWVERNKRTYIEDHPAPAMGTRIERYVAKLLQKFETAADPRPEPPPFDEVDDGSQQVERLRKTVAEIPDAAELYKFWMGQITAKALREFPARKADILRIFNDRHEALNGQPGRYK